MPSYFGSFHGICCRWLQYLHLMGKIREEINVSVQSVVIYMYKPLKNSVLALISLLVVYYHT